MATAYGPFSHLLHCASSAAKQIRERVLWSLLDSPGVSNSWLPVVTLLPQWMDGGNPLGRPSMAQSGQLLLSESALPVGRIPGWNAAGPGISVERASVLLQCGGSLDMNLAWLLGAAHHTWITSTGSVGLFLCCLVRNELHYFGGDM